MARRQLEFFYAIGREKLDRLGVAAVLDMLRYDGSTVESNAPAGFYLFRLEGHGPHLPRWNSFGMRDADIHVGMSRYEVETRCKDARKTA